MRISLTIVSSAAARSASSGSCTRVTSSSMSVLICWSSSESSSSSFTFLPLPFGSSFFFSSAGAAASGFFSSAPMLGPRRVCCGRESARQEPLRRAQVNHRTHTHPRVAAIMDGANLPRPVPGLVRLGLHTPGCTAALAEVGAYSRSSGLIKLLGCKAPHLRQPRHAWPGHLSSLLLVKRDPWCLPGPTSVSNARLSNLCTHNYVAPRDQRTFCRDSPP